MSNSERPHKQQPTRLPCPWDSPDKNTGVGCHFLLQCMKVKSESEVSQSCPTLCDPMQPTRLLHPWDFLGKSTRVGCHCLLHNYCRVIQKKICVLNTCLFLKNLQGTYCSHHSDITHPLGETLHHCSHSSLITSLSREFKYKKTVIIVKILLNSDAYSQLLCFTKFSN